MSWRSFVFSWVRFVGMLQATLFTASMLFIGTSDVSGMEPEQREATVVTGRVWEGAEYREIFVPSTSGNLTLMAGADNALIYAVTREYYWPLSRQVYVDFERQRDVLEGELVVRRDGAIIARETLQPYSILYPDGAARGQGAMLWGDEAGKAYRDYREGESRFVREFSAAQQAHAQYERKLLETGAARLRGEPLQTVEPPPPLPEPSLKLVTAPLQAFRIALEPGTYDIALEQDGRVVPGTERSVRVIQQAGRATLVADVVPEERWTRPLASNIGQARIFARPGATIYMTLFEAARFEESEYLPIVSPQSSPVSGRSLFVRRHPAAVDRLQVAWNGDTSTTVERQPFKVEQTAGSSFGYRVRPAMTGEASDLNAFAIEVPSDGQTLRGAIEAAGDAPSFDRSIVVVRERQSPVALVLALMPFAIYLTAQIARRRQS